MEKYLNITITKFSEINTYDNGRILTLSQVLSSNMYEYAFGMKFPKDYSWAYWSQISSLRVHIFKKVFRYEE